MKRVGDTCDRHLARRTSVVLAGVLVCAVASSLAAAEPSAQGRVATGGEPSAQDREAIGRKSQHPEANDERRLQIPDQTVDEDSKPISIDLTAHFPVKGKPMFEVERNSAPKLVSAVVKDGKLELSFAPDASGKATLAVRPTDRGEHAQQFTVTVRPQNDPPVPRSTPIVITGLDALSSVAVDLSDAFFDAEGDAITYAVTANDNPKLASAKLDGKRVAIALAPDVKGKARITVTATDKAGATGQTVIACDVAVPATKHQVSVDQIPANLKSPNPKGMAVKVLERSDT